MLAAQPVPVCLLLAKSASVHIEVIRRGTFLPLLVHVDLQRIFCLHGSPYVMPVKPVLQITLYICEVTEQGEAGSGLRTCITTTLPTLILLDDLWTRAWPRRLANHLASSEWM